MIELFKFGYSPVTSFTVINLLLNFSSQRRMGERTENKVQILCMPADRHILSAALFSWWSRIAIPKCVCVVWPSSNDTEKYPAGVIQLTLMCFALSKCWVAVCNIEPVPLPLPAVLPLSQHPEQQGGDCHVRNLLTHLRGLFYTAACILPVIGS